jgi:threonine dehydrogenase-like Zn-dependent dehydrogenase
MENDLLCDTHGCDGSVRTTFSQSRREGEMNRRTRESRTAKEGGPMANDARAFWVCPPSTGGSDGADHRTAGEIRPVDLPRPGPDEVLVRTRYSGISRGTETLVLRGEVPPSQYAAMRAPFQAGDFPGPVKYGYLNVGVVEEGPGPLLGRTVFCLYPHQTAYVVPAAAVTVVPDGVPADRAVLAGTVETAVNALWDARPLVGDRVSVVGAGMVGCCVARLLAGLPGVDVELVDVDPERGLVAESLGVSFAGPDHARRGRDLVFHASASATGLRTALDCLAPEGTVVELSWYGEREVRLALGGAFHSGRLSIRGSQVGTLSPNRRTGRTHADRMALALDLLRDPAFDSLLSGASPFEALPEVLAGIAAGRVRALTHVITYLGE